RLCRWVARPLPELRNGCLPWSDAGGGGRFVAMIRVFRYTRSDSRIRHFQLIAGKMAWNLIR
ncbi:hypothetical protein, partial [Neisseria mucosa]|uniref:hypothetical protein n=1 Tax=Neisseria mucosa TaxID=488 RepID=UPI00254DC55B